MKNKKKGVLIAVVVIALIVVAVAAVCINKKAGDSGKLKEGQTEATVKKSDTKVITFAVPDICRIDENNIKQFNAALMNDGYDYELNIKYLEYDEYSQKLESTLAAGKTDVAFLGLGDENGNNPLVIRNWGSLDALAGSVSDSKTWVDQAVREKTDLPALYSGIGTEDFSFADSVRYLAYCRKQGLEIHSLEIPGKHEWKVWDTLISDFMDWAMLHAVR